MTPPHSGQGSLSLIIIFTVLAVTAFLMVWIVVLKINLVLMFTFNRTIVYFQIVARYHADNVQSATVVVTDIRMRTVYTFLIAHFFVHFFPTSLNIAKARFLASAAVSFTNPP